MTTDPLDIINEFMKWSPQKELVPCPIDLKTINRVWLTKLCALAERVSEAENKAAELEAQLPRWIPVSERLPVKYDIYNVFVKINISGFPDWKDRSVYECVYSEFGWHTANEVVCWMPLPEPPKE